MEVSKIHLSAAEMELMQNAEIILTKNTVLEKIKVLLEELQEEQIRFSKKYHAGNEIFKIPPKISKGENYLGLPYLILDYPRQSSETKFFFIRTMFWWGNFFSCTLHLANESKNIFKSKIKNSYPSLNNYFISIKNDPWVHHLKESDYKRIGLMSRQEFENTCEEFSHIKIAGRHSLTEIGDKPTELFENWKNFIYVCGLIS